MYLHDDLDALIATIRFIEQREHSNMILGLRLNSECVIQRQPLYIPGSVPNDQVLTNFELYINNIFVNPEIHDIYIHRIGFSLIRVHRRHEEVLSNPQMDVILSSLKWPTEYLYCGLRPLENKTGTLPPSSGATNFTPYQKELWRRFRRKRKSSNLMQNS